MKNRKLVKTRVCMSQGAGSQKCFGRVLTHVLYGETPGRRSKSCVLKICNTQKAVMYHTNERKNWGVPVGEFMCYICSPNFLNFFSSCAGTCPNDAWQLKRGAPRRHAPHLYTYIFVHIRDTFFTFACELFLCGLRHGFCSLDCNISALLNCGANARRRVF